MAQQVPWEEWEDVARLGGEVAEAKVKSHVATPKRPGAKPKPRIEGVVETVRAYKEAKAKRKGKASPVVAAFSVKPKPKPKQGGPGAGK